MRAEAHQNNDDQDDVNVNDVNVTLKHYHDNYYNDEDDHAAENDENDVQDSLCIREPTTH